VNGKLARVAGESVGSYPITLGDLSAGEKYDLVFIPSEFIITGDVKIPITVIAEEKSKSYGDVDPVLTYTVSPANSGAVFTGKLARDGGENVAGSPYGIFLGTLTAGRNYLITFVKANFTINPKQITVTAHPKTIQTGNPDPAFTYTATPGLLNGDQFTGSLTCNHPATPGRYIIKQGTLSASNNYLIIYVSNWLTIVNSNAKHITVTADSGQFKMYGAPNPVYTYTVDPPLDAGDSFTGALSRDPGVDAGIPYPITLGTLSAGLNYIIDFVSADFYIKGIPVNVKANAASKPYGSPDPGFTYSWEPELMDGDSFTGDLARDPGENAGNYNISKGSLTAGPNYEITFTSDLFTITPVSLVIKADNKSVQYGDSFGCCGG
jgi:hypothetical protein